MRRSVAAAAALISVCAPMVASAVDFSVNGFSTAGYTTIDNDNAEYAYSTFSEGVTSDGSFEYDSMVGLQGTAKFGDEWSVVAQVLMRKQTDGKFGPNVDWAYLKWEPTNDLMVRGGLTRVPTFYYSDSVFLGYATPWVRPPIEVYGLSPVYLLEGMDAVWHTDVGPVSVDVQAFYGQSDLEIYATSKLQPGVPPRGTVCQAISATFMMNQPSSSGTRPCSVSSIFAVLEATLASGSRELELVAAQDVIANPPAGLTSRRLR